MFQVIVCAAMRRNGLIICGARHFDSIMRATIKAMGTDHRGWEQGFIDNKGAFLTRAEAWKIAIREGQIRRETGVKNKLFSENLY
jgi:hypothetical protein